MKNWRLEAAIMAVGLLLLGWMLRGGINDFRDRERVVTVKGLAEMEVPADKVVWPLVHKDIGNDPAVIYANIEKKNAAIVAFLKNNGISDAEISIAPPEIIDMEAERYANQNVNYRYNATSHHRDVEERGQRAQADDRTGRTAEAGHRHRRR